jgi:serine/threonine-protein kinase
VFRARDETTDRIVALKLFTMGLAADPADRLVREFERIIAADVVHSTVVRPLDTGVCAGTPYLAQEYVAGGSLDSIVRQHGKLPRAEVVRIAIELAGAVDFAAVVGIHHGALHLKDVLPRDATTRATGFGVAQAIERAGIAAPLRTRHAAIHQRDDSRIDHDADIVAVAGVVHELLFGCPLGTRRTGIDSKENIEMADPLELRRVFDRVLGARDGDRFKTALEFVAALIAALGFDEAPDAATLDGREESAVSAASVSMDREAAERTQTPSAKWMAAAAVLIAIAAGAAAYRGYYARTPAAVTQAVPAPTPRGSASANQALDTTTAVGARTPPTSLASGERRDRPAAPSKAPAVKVGVKAAGADESLAGMLFVDSHPRGAALFVDEKFIGTTPLAVSAMTSGEHTLRVETDGYEAWSSRVRVPANRLTKITATLDR